MKKNCVYRHLVAGLAFLVILCGTPVLSFAAQGTGIVGVKARYSSDIEPEKGDQFIISYENSDSGESGTISLDASEADDVYIDFEIPIGSYEVTDVVYSGSNESIEEQGYGVEGAFRVRDEEDAAVLYLYIGSTAVENLDRSYSDAVIKDSEHDENGKQIVFEDRGGRYTIEEDEDGNTYIQYLDEDSDETSNNGTDGPEEPSDAPGEESDVPESNDTSTENGQEPITEYHETGEQEEEDSNSLRDTVIIVVIIAAIVGLVIFVLRKKKLL